MASTIPKRRTGYADRVGSVNGQQRGSRLLMWVDAVGGYLVCLGNDVTLGQAVPGSPADIAIIGDVSRRHVAFRRYSEGYLLVPYAPCQVQGRAVATPQLLADGDELVVGTSVRVRFRQPHPLSPTCRLEFLSDHRPKPAVDGVLLMAETCILGPSPHNHVVCRHWSGDLILARGAGGFMYRCASRAEVDGKDCDTTGTLTFDSRISGPDFCVTLEQLH